MDNSGACERAFRSFTSLLTVVPAALEAGPREQGEATAPAMRDEGAEPECACAAAGARLLAESTLLRVATYEACERACRLAVRRLAEDVLARELQLAPVDIDRLVAQTLRKLVAEEPLALAVAPGDAARLHVDLRVVADPALRSGDLVVRVKDGAIDARLQVRLASALCDGEPLLATAPAHLASKT